MDTVICKEVIVCSIARRGNGTQLSPIRVVTQVFEKDGTLIAEKDPAPETYAAMDLIHFARWCQDNKLNAETLAPSHIEKWLKEISTNEQQ